METTRKNPAGAAENGLDPESPFEEAAPDSAAQPVADGSGGSNELAAFLVTSPHGSAEIASKNADDARGIPGVAAVIFSEDLGEINRLGAVRQDEPLLAEETTEFRGQPVAIVVAESEAIAVEAAGSIRIDFHARQAILDIEHAVAMKSYHGESCSIARGESEKAIAEASIKLEGSLSIGSQLPFPRGELKARVIPDNDGGLEVEIQSELPDRVRSAVAAVARLPESSVRVRTEKLGCQAGGRRDEAAYVAALAALAAAETGGTVSLQLDRRSDAVLGAKRHPVQATFRAGFESDGSIAGVEIDFLIDGGHAPGSSEAALDQILLHADAAYFVPDFRVSGRLCRTNRVTGEAMPAEGMAQGALAMEEIVTRVANRLGLPPDQVRERNFYREAGNRHSTHFGQPVGGDKLEKLWRDSIGQAQLESRRERIRNWNEDNPCYKRGIASLPLKAGIGDPRAERNQATVAVQLLADGSMTVCLGCVDNGSGLPAWIAEETGRQFGIDPERVRVRCGDLDFISGMTARIGTDGAGLMRQALADACLQLRERLRPVGVQLLAGAGVPDVDEESIRFTSDGIRAGAQSNAAIPFQVIAGTALRRRINLAAIGFFRTPNLWWDREVGAGWPFAGFLFGAATVEVQLDAFTGEVQILQADVVFPGGTGSQTDSERAQVARSLSLGFGWMLNETVRWDESGGLVSDSGERYAFPGFGDAPLRLNIEMIPSPGGDPAENCAASGAESAVILAGAAREAIREAIRSFGAGPDVEVDLPVPATPDAVLRALRDMSRQLAEARRTEGAEEG